MAAVGSSAESPGGSKSAEKSQEVNKRDSKYKCPEDYVPYKYTSTASALLGNNKHTELWLIKAPVHFNPESLKGLKVPLSGLEMIQSTGDTPQIYSVLGSDAGPSDLHLLTSSSKDESVSVSASAFSGVLSISESYGDCSGNQDHIPIPAAPAPSIPPGLRQRFQPFGSSTPTRTAWTSPSMSKRVKLEPEEAEEQTMKKKKKKKEKHNREETETVLIKQERISYDYGDLSRPEEVEEKRKKLKKERQDREEEVAIDRLTCKEEPVDDMYGDIDTSGKKKKKKKKKHVDE